ncbi:MAG TPA: cytochrome d ubiquinol oxidase subunit II, partial [Anaerolineae bacterium]
GVALEFRSKDDNPRWRRLWDWAIFIGSALPALLWGVAVANIVHGVAIDSGMHFVGSFFDLLNPYALLGGLVTLSLFILHGALFLELRTDGVVRQRVQQVARYAWIPVLIFVLAFVAFSAFQTTMFTALSVVKLAALALAVIALLAVIVLIWRKRYGLAFIGTSVTVVSTVVLLFGTLFPRVMPSTLNAAYDLTIYNASSSPYTLQVMSVVALTLVPIVLAYQAWTYWVFRKRLTSHSRLEY